MSQNLFWVPAREQSATTNLAKLMAVTGTPDFAAVHIWSVGHLTDFWDYTLKALGIELRTPYSQLLDTSQGVQKARWLADASMSIVDSCFHAPADTPAIITQRQDGGLETVTIRQLDELSNRVANGLLALGLQKGDAIAIDMALTVEAVAIYFGILKMGGAVISIADSFPAEEIAKRLQIGNAQAVFTQATIIRAGKRLPMYEKVCAAAAPQTVVLFSKTDTLTALRTRDRLWTEFLSADRRFSTVACTPQDPINILFSSGTTGVPKAIPWDHTTAIKAAADAYYHQDIHPGDVVCWPTNLGWMMGPWLLFASLINRAVIALYEGAPNERGFCEFVQNAHVTMLGLVPSIVKSWRSSKLAEGLDWRALRCFSSTGEASDPQDYRWLMQLNQPAGVIKPVVEYCGGTEIGGGYIGNNLVTPQEPGEFNGKIMGSDCVILDDDGCPCPTGGVGEVFLVPPALGLSVRLLNNDNDSVYYQDCPTWNGKVLRRHGDRLRVLGPQCFQSDGRADNTMNLGGIKVGSAEIERIVNTLPGVLETAAIGIPPAEGGPDRLIIFAVVDAGTERETMKAQMQRSIKDRINPLYHLLDVVFVETLPRTASHKVMHKDLRAQYRARESTATP
jgi:acetyl-CoA synthetase